MESREGQESCNSIWNADLDYCNNCHSYTEKNVCPDCKDVTAMEKYQSATENSIGLALKKFNAAFRKLGYETIKFILGWKKK